VALNHTNTGADQRKSCARTSVLTRTTHGPLKSEYSLGGAERMPHSQRGRKVGHFAAVTMAQRLSSPTSAVASVWVSSAHLECPTLQQQLSRQRLDNCLILRSCVACQVGVSKWSPKGVLERRPGPYADVFS
jgi:hypothetical protein